MNGHELDEVDPFCQCGYRRSKHKDEFHPHWQAHGESPEDHTLGHGGRFQRSIAFNEAERFHLRRQQLAAFPT